jgi:hypothetical protein
VYRRAGATLASEVIDVATRGLTDFYISSIIELLVVELLEQDTEETLITDAVDREAGFGIRTGMFFVFARGLGGRNK